jgi:HSP20 family protein
MSDITTQNNGHASPAPAQARRAVAPAVDVLENDDELLIVADVPGVASTGIDLRVENGTLRLEAKRPAGAEKSPALVREFEEVDFATTLRIPDGIDTAGISAQTKNGTLQVRLPKAAASKPRKIDVH